MGLYLCVFDDDEELDGVEIGSYADFGFFRDTVVTAARGGPHEANFPLLLGHHDSDGQWEPSEAALLVDELRLASQLMAGKAPVAFNSEWKGQVARSAGIRPSNLLECFFDVDGEPLVDRLIRLAEVSRQKMVPILFQ